MEFLINLGPQIAESYTAWQWHTFPNECSSGARKIIDRNMTELRQWALTLGIVSASEERYPLIGDTVPSIGRTRKSGLITYDIKPLLPEIEPLGLSKDAHCIVLHMPSLIEQKEVNDSIVNLFSSRSFKKLKNVIQSKHKAVQAIVAESWLLDTAIGARLGFHLLPHKSEEITWHSGFWGQFIDQHGNMHRKRVNHFLKTGKPPYRVRRGYILVKDIL